MSISSPWTDGGCFFLTITSDDDNLVVDSSARIAVRVASWRSSPPAGHHFDGVLFFLFSGGPVDLDLFHREPSTLVWLAGRS